MASRQRPAVLSVRLARYGHLEPDHVDQGLHGTDDQVVVLGRGQESGSPGGGVPGVSTSLRNCEKSLLASL